MKLTLHRKYLGDKYTIGHLFIDDKYFCDVIEDVVRDKNKDGDLNDLGEGKIYGETAIPYGTYKVVLSMSARFGRILPAILDVPHFTGIRIHRGNTAYDTHGCLIVGLNKEKGKVIQSTIYENELIRTLEKATGDIYIEIK